ncbi:GAF and ANTAR domain-containing protein [Nocardia sp. JMUB6875]
MMIRHVGAESFAIGLAQLTSSVLSAQDLATSLCDITDFVTAMAPERTMSRVTLTHAVVADIADSGGVPAPPMGELPLDHPIGPCSESIATGRVVMVPELRVERRWVGYPARMLELGVRSILVQPIPVPHRTIGAVALYAPEPGAFDESLCRRLALTAAQVGALLAAVIASTRRAESTTRLMADLTARSAIDQAVGVLISQRSSSAADALAILREAADLQGIRLHEAAAEVIRAATGNGPAPVHFDPPERPTSIRGRRIL